MSESSPTSEVSVVHEPDAQRYAAYIDGALAGFTGAPMLLVTRNPAVKSLADFSSKDRIAVPTVKVSAQAVMLQIAAERQLGEAGRNKLDPITIQLGHPDAVGALLGGTSEVNSHFSLPPYQQIELKDPKIHVVLNSYDVVGGPLSNAIVFGRGKFMEQNPKTTAAVLAAARDLFSVVKSKKVKISVNQTYALKDAAIAHADLEGRKTTGSTVLIP